MYVRSSTKFYYAAVYSKQAALRVCVSRMGYYLEIKKNVEKPKICVNIPRDKSVGVSNGRMDGRTRPEMRPVRTAA